MTSLRALGLIPSARCFVALPCLSRGGLYCRICRLGRPYLSLLQKCLQRSEVWALTGPTFAFRNPSLRGGRPLTWCSVRGANLAPAKVAGVGTRRSDPCRNPCKTRRYERPRVRLLQKSLQGWQVRVPTGPTFAFRKRRARRGRSSTRPFARGADLAPAKVAGVGTRRSDPCRNACGKARCGRPYFRLLQGILQDPEVRAPMAHTGRTFAQRGCGRCS